MTMQQFNPPHPGEFIREVYLEPLGMSANEASKKLKVHSSTFGRLIGGKSNVSPEMALRLEAVFGRSAESWMAMQDGYDLAQARPKFDISGLEPVLFD
ncbi:HigA family addiction module antitoxin [Thalassospira sp.]|uniref:HigA family addiction module antitoxin n=1 Tax=Thalassospira sp. TaxID=1912094 RepID=UPI0027333FC9|nr:HigA family addiction module antitoxin [Thalassospira sp.]MDP2697490.1 HigA family addiction module antitoxin [Thalassospira sp.]